jgi:hypothetical protein
MARPFLIPVSTLPFLLIHSDDGLAQTNSGGIAATNSSSVPKRCALLGVSIVQLKEQ